MTPKATADIGTKAPAEAAPPGRAPSATTAIHETILETVGDTPLVRLRHLGEGCPATVVAKVESFNPGGSVKDRIAVAIVAEA